MEIVKYTVRSISDLLKVLPRIYGTPSRTVWFRGQENEEWKLLPSLIRPPNRSVKEIVYLKRFKQHAAPFLEQVPLHEWDWLFLMQHYEVPTRLLDWSESALVGLYFALVEPKKTSGKNKPGAVWCLYPNELNMISKLDMNPPEDIPCFGDDVLLEKYLPSRVIGVTTADSNPVALVAPRQFKRLYAQQGVFTLFHRNATPIEQLGDQRHIRKIVIPVAAKARLRRELAYLRVDELALFPELDKVGRHVNEIQP
jgi:FRG domain